MILVPLANDAVEVYLFICSARSWLEVDKCRLVFLREATQGWFLPGTTLDAWKL